MTDFAEICLVRERGYNAFKCISQSTFRPTRPGVFRGSQAMPLSYHARTLPLRTLMAIPGALPAAKAVKRALRPNPGTPAAPLPSGTHLNAATVSTLAWQGGTWSFPFGSSGPFGDDLEGRWKTAEEALYEFLDYTVNRARKFRSTIYSGGDWFDIHATTLPEAPRPAP